MKLDTILFICTGNICRSPMAEQLFRHRTRNRPHWIAASAGVAACDGLRASAAAIAVLAEMGIEAGTHMSRALTRQMLLDAYIVLAMTELHKSEVLGAHPFAADKVYLLGSFAEPPAGDIADPIGSTIDVYRNTRDEIEAALPGLIRFLDQALARPD